jgi:hypothetical protein
MPPATNREKLIQNFKKAWASTEPDILENLICCMPERVKKCLKMNGKHIGK